MKMNKIVLTGLMFAMPFAGQASFGGNSNKSTEPAEAVVAMMGYVFLSPVIGLMKGCERRTLQQMQDRVLNQLTTEQALTFKKNYVSEKIDTKPYTTAIGPLVLITAGGIAIANPAGILLASVATGLNLTALLIAERGQTHNMNVYEKTLQALNAQRAVDKQEPVNGYKGLSDMQKIFCIGTGRR